MWKLVLSVLRGPAAEKNAEKCHLQFVEGLEPGQQTLEDDSIETRLVLKLRYKHGDKFCPLRSIPTLMFPLPGVIKTHTFPLLSSTKPQAPHLPSGRPISSVRIGGRTLKELIEHFPKPDRGATGSKGDPLLIWQFHDDKASIKTEDRWGAAKNDWNSTAGKGGRRGAALLEGDGDNEETVSE